MSLLLIGPAQAAHLTGESATYTSDADFDEGSSINVVHSVPGQLQLDDTTGSFPFIWIAASARGTIVKVDTATGAIKGEYKSSPDGRARNPSRTTVDANGNVWAGNRDEAGSVAGSPRGSVVHIGLVENGQCVDRNGNGTIETSTGLGNILGWPNSGGLDTDGGVDTAVDECIIHYVRTHAVNVRHVSLDGANNVWVGGAAFGAFPRYYQLLSPTGTSLRTINVAVPGDTGEPGSIVQCCYGGLVDGNGILWSATLEGRDVIRIDPSRPNGDPALITRIALPGSKYSYGMATDSAGNIWVSNWIYNSITKISPAGVVLGSFGAGSGSRGMGVTPADDNVWVANSFSNTVTRHSNAGALLVSISVGSQPTGISVDAAGKVWVTNLSSNNAMRIDPTTNTVDLTVDLGGGAGPYNYSDMTGSTIIAAPTSGTWSVVHDTGRANAEWGTVSWNGLVAGNGALAVTVASSNDGTTFSAPQAATNGGDLSVPNGRYVKVTVAFTRASTGESPILYDLTVAPVPLNTPPTAVAGGPYTVAEGSSVALDGSGSTDPDGDTLSYAWDLDNDGVYETAGVTATFSAAGKDGPGSATVGLQVCDPSGACDSAKTTVTITNVAPVADAGPAVTVYRNEAAALSGTFTDPAGALDAPFAWTWDTDGDGIADSSGSAAYGASVPASATFGTAGTYVLGFGVTDKDGGAGSATVSVTVLNRAPSCAAAAPSVASIWPPNHKFVAVKILGVTDAEGDMVTIVITGIRQDEPLNKLGDGSTELDGAGVGTDTAQVRAERSGTPKTPGDGRVYHISFTADDGNGGSCTGTVQVAVPHDQGKGATAVDGGPLYDSVAP